MSQPDDVLVRQWEREVAESKRLALSTLSEAEGLLSDLRRAVTEDGIASGETLCEASAAVFERLMTQVIRWRVCVETLKKARRLSEQQAGYDHEGYQQRKVDSVRRALGDLPERATDAVIAEREARSPDFNTAHLTGRAKDIADSIVAFLTKRTGEPPWGGGCKAFYSPEEWRDRAEEYGRDSLLILCHDGGDLAPYVNFDYENYQAVEALREHMKTLGVYVEPCTTWYAAVYNVND